MTGSPVQPEQSNQPGAAPLFPRLPLAPTAGQEYRNPESTDTTLADTSPHKISLPNSENPTTKRRDMTATAGKLPGQVTPEELDAWLRSTEVQEGDDGGPGCGGAGGSSPGPGAGAGPKRHIMLTSDCMKDGKTDSSYHLCPHQSDI